MNVMKKITLFMSCLLLLLVALQARAAEFYVETLYPDQVYMHIWNGDGTLYHDDNGHDMPWPGVVLRRVAAQSSITGYWHFQVPDGYNIIFNGSGQQAPEISSVYGVYYIDYPKDGTSWNAYGEFTTLVDNFTIFGNKDLLGTANDWDAASTENQMTYQSGTYKLVKENVELQPVIYEYKVVANHDPNVWVYPQGNSNVLTVDKHATYNVTFTYDAAAHNLNAETELVSDIYVLRYGHDADQNHESSNWTDVTFAQGTGDNEGKLVATVNFPAGDEFVINEGDNWYHPASNDYYTRLVDFFNCEGISLSTDQNGNFHINDAGEYTFVLYKDENNNLKLDVQTFTEPPIYLQYGKDDPEIGWQNVDFESEARGNERRFMASINNFPAGDELVIHYGSRWYGSKQSSLEEVDYDHNELTLSNGTEGHQNFVINKAGDYTFMLTLGETNTLVVNGFEEPPFMLEYGVAGQDWASVQFVEGEGGTLVATVPDGFPAGNDFLITKGEGNKKIYYGVAPNADNLVDYFNPNMTLVTEGHQNLHINEGGNYTFVLSFNDDNLLLNVQGFTKPDYVLKYGEAGAENWTNVTFQEVDGNLVANVPQFPAGNDFLVKYGRYEYGAGNQDDPLVDYFHNSGIELKAEGKQNFHITEAGDYTFVLTLNNEYPASISVQTFEKPTYKLSYGAAGAQNWSGLETFVSGEEGKLVVSNVEFSANDEFVITYGRYKYSSNAEGDYWLVDREHCTNLSLIRDGKNFRFDEAGTYTFEITLDEDGFPATLNVTFPTKPYVLHYGTVQPWLDKTFENGTGEYEGKLVAANVEFAADTRFGIMHDGTWYAGDVVDPEITKPYEIKADWHTNIPVVDAQHAANLKDFIITTPGTYTFILTIGENGITMDVLGFPVEYPRGDVDGDGKVDVSDINAVVNIILGKTTQADYPGNANIVEEEGDPQGKVDVSDLNAIVNIILGKSIE